MRAVLFLNEQQRLTRSSRLYKKARAIRGVVDAYPCLGRFDGVVFIEAPNAEAVNDVVVRVNRLEGVEHSDLHVEAPKRA